MKKVKLEVKAEAKKDDGLREMSLQEKTLMKRVLGDQPELPYPLHDLPMPEGFRPEREYEIPGADRAELLRRLYFLVPAPALEDERYDLHEKRVFKVRDLRIIRWNDANLLVSPDYPKSGGTLLDWVGTEAGAMQIVASLVSPEYQVK